MFTCVVQVDFLFETPKQRPLLEPLSQQSSLAKEFMRRLFAEVCTVGQRLSREDAEQVTKDIEAHRKFVALCKEFETLTMRLGDVEVDAVLAPEKKRPRSRSSRTKKVGRILERAAHARHADLEAWENALRAAVLSAGAKALASLLDGVGCGRQDEAIVCNGCRSDIYNDVNNLQAHYRWYVTDCF